MIEVHVIHLGRLNRPAPEEAAPANAQASDSVEFQKQGTETPAPLAARNIELAAENERLRQQLLELDTANSSLAKEVALAQTEAQQQRELALSLATHIGEALDLIGQGRTGKREVRQALNMAATRLVWAGSPVQRYTHIRDGGEYVLVGEAKGTGLSRECAYTVYRSVETGALYWREPGSFASWLKPLKGMPA